GLERARDERAPADRGGPQVRRPARLREPTPRRARDERRLDGGGHPLLREGVSAEACAMSDRASSAAPPALRGARAAFTFLSRLPVGGFPYCSADWRWAPAHFPLVGAAVGGLSCGVYWLAAPLG